MSDLREIISYLDAQLRTAEIPDYSGAVNGLQLENAGRVTRIAAAVDASLPVVEAAVAAGADLLLVHHGMFWQGTQPLTLAYYKKIKTAMDAGLAIYSSHLPLDIHPEWGNNMQLLRALGLSASGTFFDWKGIRLGLTAEVEIARPVLVGQLSTTVGGPVHVCPGGPEKIRKIGLVTGGAGSEVALCVSSGIDTFITGEGPHWSYPLAEELGINLLYAGHYATETFGVRALAAHLADKHGIPWSFIDRPTGL